MLIYPMLAVQLLLSIHIQKLQAQFYSIKYSSSVIICAFGATILMLTQTVSMDTTSFNFLKDYRFYLAQFFNIAMIMIQVEGRKKNEKNMAIFYFSSFLIISIVPVLTPLLTHFLGFERGISAQYSSPYTMAAMVICMLVLTIIFYLNKIKSQTLERIDLLVWNVLFGSVAIILGGKMMQEYNAISYLIAANILNVLVFTFFALKNGEHKRLNTSCFQPIPMAQMICCFATTLYLSSLIIQNTTVESYTILRNVGIILMSYVYTWVVEKQKTHNLRDTVLLSLMIGTLIVFSK